jgi:predicted nucleic acid-binding protein
VLPQAVADAGPLIHLAQINKLLLIKNLFSRVSVIPEVKKEAFDEGIRLGYADAHIVGKAIEEGWIVIKEASDTVALAAEKLAEGENISQTDAKTLLLAKESGADILVDEKILSDLAKMYGLKVWNTWTLLLESLRRGFIRVSDIESAITELGERRHKLKGKQAAEILKAAKLIASSRKKHDGLEV